ncbi:hypothetical protein CLU79DRAFT_450286 [Phycomyces nitens]|nr:hypothetical protein CLU79DRAFT_450286 [Phycomyces nitens]
MEPTTLEYICLFTSQKQKKFKTWQDGTMKYYTKNRKLILVDEKGYVIDNQFFRGGIPAEGDEVEFDKHIATIESVCSQQLDTVLGQPDPTARVSVQEPPVARLPSHDYRQARMRLLSMDEIPTTTSAAVIPLAYNRSSAGLNRPNQTLHPDQSIQPSRSSSIISRAPKSNAFVNNPSAKHVQSVESIKDDSMFESLDDSCLETLDIGYEEAAGSSDMTNTNEPKTKSRSLATKPFVNPIIQKTVNNNGSPKRTVNYGVSRHSLGGDSTVGSDRSRDNDDRDCIENTLPSTKEGGNVSDFIKLLETKHNIIG